MRGVLGLSLVLGAFALVNAAASLLALGLARVLRGRAARLDARRRGDLWLGLRLFPAAAALLAAVLVAAAFARHEPKDANETVGPGLLVLAAAGAALTAASLRRVFRAHRATRRFLVERTAGARPLALAGAPTPVLRVTQTVPAVALVGTRRPTLFVAESALSSFTPEELAVVLAHESAHVRARDNLKTLLVLGAAFPGGLGGRIERDWRQAAEEWADERAAGGFADRSLSLASALLKVARLTPTGSLGELLGATTLHRGEGLALRVHRLLAGARSGGGAPAGDGTPSVGRRILLLALASSGAALSLPFLLPALHRALEIVVRVLS